MKYKNKRFIDENIPIKELFKAGFLKSKTDYNDIEKRVCTFFWTTKYLSISAYNG